MQKTPYDERAGRQTVSLTINRDLYAQTKALGINASRVAEKALGEELQRQRAAQLAAEVQRDLTAYNAFVDKHGSFAQLAREQYEAEQGDGSV
jgi:antitoxin CcdA